MTSSLSSADLIILNNKYKKDLDFINMQLDAVDAIGIVSFYGGGLLFSAGLYFLFQEYIDNSSFSEFSTIKITAVLTSGLTLCIMGKIFKWVVTEKTLN